MENFDVILSLTTWKERLKNDNVLKTLKSLLNQKTNLKTKIVLNVFKDDLIYINENLKRFINEHDIEILECNLDLKSHKKYFYVMQKYRTKPIILFDDDLIYRNNTVQLLYNNYIKFPNSISARRCRIIPYDNYGIAKGYEQWNIYKNYNSQPSLDLLATTGGGTLFPPNILDIAKNDIQLIYKFLTADDIFLKYKMNKMDIKVSYVYDTNLPYAQQKESIDKSSLCFKNTQNECLNNKYIKLANIRNYKNKEKIIVSMTSWKKRINDVYQTVQKILNGTLLPDKIILNLSEEEFPNKENDIPYDLILLQNISTLFIINWVKNDTKPYKKTIPTLKKYPNDIIITIDDDIDYPSNFIENIYYKFIYSDRKNPITSGDNKWWDKIYSHAGGSSLIKNEMFGNFLYDLYNNLVKKDFEKYKFADPIITYAILLNDKKYIFTENMNMTKISRKTHKNENSLSKIGTDEYKNYLQNEHELIQKYIKKTYGIDIKQKISY